MRAHPDLAGRAALAGELTPESAAEQASAGLDRMTPADLARFTALNDAYRARFGFPFVIRVRGRSVAEILAAYERRLANDAEAERARRDRGDRRDHAPARSRTRHELRPRGPGRRLGRRRGRRPDRRGRPGPRRRAPGDRRARPAGAAGGGRRPRPPQRPRARRLGGLRRPARGRSPRAGSPAPATCRSTPSRRPSTRPPSTPRSRPPVGAPGSTSRSGAAWCRATSARLDALAERGVVGFKAFMCPSGVDEFPAADPDTLGRGMERAAALGLPVAVHAEDPEIVGRLAEEARAAGRTSMADWAASRPPEAELAAIRLALSLAEQAGCALHVVHVSTAEGAGLVAEARARGVDATCEACPHHLVLDEGDAARIGALAKCAPPLRSSAERRALWGRVAAGAVDLVASDHSPGPAGAEDGGGHVRGVGRDLGRADDAAADAERGPRPRRRARARRRAAGRGPGRPAGAGGQGAPGAGRRRRHRHRADRRGVDAGARGPRVPPPPLAVHGAAPERAGGPHHPARPDRLGRGRRPGRPGRRRGWSRRPRRWPGDRAARAHDGPARPRRDRPRELTSPGPVPGWSGAEHVQLVAPAMGARFSMALVAIERGRGGRPAGGRLRPGRLRRWRAALALAGGRARERLGPGGFAYLPPGEPSRADRRRSRPASASSTSRTRRWRGRRRSRLVVGDADEVRAAATSWATRACA